MKEGAELTSALALTENKSSASDVPSLNNQKQQEDLTFKRYE
jgi:hypothetical protein